ncbi:MAG: hypothetical protein WC455_18460 [Dehalococcoidia bacterium]|jgi:hypothetical protein
MKNFMVALVFMICSCAAVKSVPTDTQIKIACTALCTALESDNCFTKPDSQTALDIGQDAVSCLAKCDTPSFSIDIGCFGSAMDDSGSVCEDYLSCASVK